MDGLFCFCLRYNLLLLKAVEPLIAAKIKYRFRVTDTVQRLQGPRDDGITKFCKAYEWYAEIKHSDVIFQVK